MLDRLLTLIDRTTERAARGSARSNGRRSFLAKAGTLLVGGALVPVLPFERGLGALAAEGEADAGSDADCAYWRYCALDGNLCSTSGGGVAQCPPGAEASKVAWVGTCMNPGDSKQYLISYSDCCGRAQLDGATFCFSSEGERPGYRMGLYNDINWCMANANQGYHCTVAVVVGLADE